MWILALVRVIPRQRWPHSVLQVGAKSQSSISCIVVLCCDRIPLRIYLYIYFTLIIHPLSPSFLKSCVSRSSSISIFSLFPRLLSSSFTLFFYPLLLPSSFTLFFYPSFALLFPIILASRICPSSGIVYLAHIRLCPAHPPSLPSYFLLILTSSHPHILTRLYSHAATRSLNHIVCVQSWASSQPAVIRTIYCPVSTRRHIYRQASTSFASRITQVTFILHPSSTMLASILFAVATATMASAHTVMVYPGWRGDNLVTNETFPYGMQWMYPCKLKLALFPTHRKYQLT